MADDETPSAAELVASGRPGAARRRARNEALFFALAAAVLTLSWVLTPSESGVALLGWTLPPLCAWKVATGWDCLGCGLTRSFAWMGQGDLHAALDRHVLGPVLYLAVLVQIPLRGWRLWRLRRPTAGR